MLTIDALYEYKAKVEREMLMAEAKMTVICDLIAEESKHAMEEAVEAAAEDFDDECFGEDEEDEETEGGNTESQNIY